MKTERSSGAPIAELRRKKKYTCQKRKPTDKGVQYCTFDEKHAGGHSWEEK